MFNFLDDQIAISLDSAHPFYKYDKKKFSQLPGELKQSILAYEFPVVEIKTGASEEEARTLEEMATNVGLGFQIWDDYLDATASEEILGKHSE